ncbi:MAG: anaerobic ribonucleoside-triphosphate reductase, partial [Syntrophales bacterium]
HFAGVVGWDALNIYFAPYLTAMSDNEIRQFAQMRVYDFSQLTSARGGQSVFTDIHLYWEVPEHFADVPAIGPGGKFTGKTYKDYMTYAQKFVWAIFEVFKEGDATGRLFIFPRPIIHITEKFFQTPGHEDFLNLICDVAAEKGNTCFVFERDKKVKMICGCSIPEEGDGLVNDIKTPWKLRCFTIQNVSLNLPRLGYKAEGDNVKLFSMLSELMELAAKAHSQKKDFMEKLLSYGDMGPLSMLAINRDGSPYLRMDRASYLIGMVGLNELTQIYTGKQLHESADAMSFGLKIIESMKKQADKLSQKYGMRFILEQTPAETTAYRFARLDLKYFSPKAGYFVKGDLARGEIYYTNSTHLHVSAPVSPFTRVEMEGRFHPLINGGTITNVWLGESLPSKESLAMFVIKVFKDTKNTQITFSPEFTTCLACDKTFRGIKEACSFCGSRDVEVIARITEYFSNRSGWNRGKLAELRDRRRDLNLLQGLID